MSHNIKILLVKTFVSKKKKYSEEINGENLSCKIMNTTQ